MPTIGVPEMIIILVIALIVFGPRKLPDLGRSLGKSLGEFKRASNDLRNTLDEEIRIEEQHDKKEEVSQKTSEPKPTAAAEPKPTVAAEPKPTVAAEPKPTAAAEPKPTAAVAPASGIHPTEPDAGA